MDYPGVLTFWGVFLVAVFGALLVSPLAIKIAPKIGALDIPKDGRRMHEKPMPRFGGLAIFVGINLSLGIFLGHDLKILGIMLGGLVIYLIGIYDDLKGISPKWKLFGQIVSAIIVCGFDVRIMFITNHFTTKFGAEHLFFAGLVSWIITIIWIVGITNTINLVDGLDGLAAGIAVIAALSIAYTAYIHGYYLGTMGMLAIAGGALGFLPFNFYPAKIFMGDGGSLLLGYFLAAMAVVQPAKGATLLAVLVPIFVLGLPIFDTAFAIIRRTLNKRPIMEADRGHLHHRIMDTGMGQQRTVLTLYGISGVMGIAAVLFSRDLFIETIGLFLVAATLIYIFLTDASKLLPRLKAINIKKIEKIEREEKKEDKD